MTPLDYYLLGIALCCCAMVFVARKRYVIRQPRLTCLPANARSVRALLMKCR
jgi:hypothetical protein